MNRTAAPPGGNPPGPAHAAPPAPPPPPLTGAGRAGAYALVLALSVLLAVWGAFLVPLRIGGVLAPVCWVVALVGNVALGAAGGRLLGRPGSVVASLLWLAVAFTLGSRRSEGDLVVTGSATGLVFLLLGAVGGAVAYGVAATRLPPQR